MNGGLRRLVMLSINAVFGWKRLAPVDSNTSILSGGIVLQEEKDYYPVAATEGGEATAFIPEADMDVDNGIGVDDCPFMSCCMPLMALLSSRMWGRHLVRSLVVGAFASSSISAC